MHLGQGTLPCIETFSEPGAGPQQAFPPETVGKQLDNPNVIPFSVENSTLRVDSTCMAFGLTHSSVGGGQVPQRYNMTYPHHTVSRKFVFQLVFEQPYDLQETASFFSFLF